MNPNDRAHMTGRAARNLFRAGLEVPTIGWATSFAQANLMAVPKEVALDFLLFAQRNPKPCPVLDVTDAGSWSTHLAPDADLRTDIPAYRVWREGRLVAEATDATGFWRQDLVAFLIGCSFTFERALDEAGIPLRHIEQHVNVPMYETSVRCSPAGTFSGPLVVSMRPIPAGLIARAVEITSRYRAAHGTPVHIGDPEALGIKDLTKPDFGDPVEIGSDVPVFWACGVTPQIAIMRSRTDLAITHAPGHMFITDVLDTAHGRPPH